MQAKDIPDATLLTAVQNTPGVGERLRDRPSGPTDWRMRWDVRATLEAMVGPVPEKVLLAKARRLIGRDVLHGCDCGCRGDWHFPYGSCC